MYLRDLVTPEINDLQRRGIIPRSNSLYINTLVTGLKKDESVRMCLNGRRLNKIMISAYLKI